MVEYLALLRASDTSPDAWSLPVGACDLLEARLQRAGEAMAHLKEAVTRLAAISAQTSQARPGSRSSRPGAATLGRPHTFRNACRNALRTRPGYAGHVGR